MPELPEVQTTVNGISKRVVGLRISDVWSDYNSAYFKGSGNIKDPKYFKIFRNKIIGRKVIGASRRAKNILIHLEGDATILVHMKMTGHIMYGQYKFHPKLKRDPWEPISPASLKDPFNGHIHFVITFSNEKQLVLSDMRKFAKVTLIESKNIHESDHLNEIGPEPLEKTFTFQKFHERISLRPKGKIKQVLMDQSIVAGIGNIYADESLWRAGIHPMQTVTSIPVIQVKNLFKVIRETLSKGINLGGDSMSDYRNIDGEKGKFQEQHRAYRRTGEKCDKKGCGGKIIRIVELIPF